MKRRLLAFTLALTMTFTTLFTVSADDFAEDGDVSEVSEEASDTEEDLDAVSDEISDEESDENSDEISDENSDEESDAAKEEESADSEVSQSGGNSDGAVEEKTDEDISLAADGDAVAVVTDWASGTTGTSRTMETNSDGSVSTGSAYKSGNSKFSSSEDNFCYYAPKDGIDMSKDFVFSATMNIDGLIVHGDSSQAQSSAGLLIMGQTATKTPPSVCCGIAMTSNSEGVIGANTRTAFDEEGNYKVQARTEANKADSKWVKLSDSFGIGKNVGKFDITIKKVGNVYIVSCGDKKTKYSYAKENFMGADGSNNLLYPAVYAARDVDVTFSNISLEVDTRVPEKVVILEDASDNTALLGNEPELPGLKVGIVYTDGSIKEITEGYEITEYDKDTSGVQTAHIRVGDLYTDINIEILKKACTNIEITSMPMKVSYYEGQYFRTDNFVVEADYEDGSHVVLDREDYDLIVKGKVIGPNDFFTSDLAGENIEFSVRRKATDEISSGGKTASFKGSVSPLKLDSIVVASRPVKTTYYLNEEQDLRGMVIKGRYTDGNTSILSILQESEYTVSNNLDTSTEGTRTITITDNFNTNLKATLDVSVVEKKFMKAYVTSYPRTTYPLLTDTKGQSMRYWYDYYNGIGDGTVGTDEDETSQYNQGRLQVTYRYSSGDEEVIPEGDEYEIVLDNFDLTDASDNNEIIIRFPETSQAYGTNDIAIPISIKVYSVNYWKPHIFGASTTTSKSRGPDQDKMGMILTEADGTVTNFDTTGSSGTAAKSSDGDYYEDKYKGDRRIEESGSSLRIWANQGAGKQADSNDGMSFYYTRLNFDDDFKLSADIEVNSYVQGDEDENRDGQEGFGIMARDVINLTPSEEYKKKVEAEGGNIYTEVGGKKIQFVYKYEDAAKDKYGEPIPYNTAIYNYANMVLLGGHSGGSWPSDPKADSYLFNTQKNRINLIYRTFIENDPYAASSNVMRSSVVNTLSGEFPSPGTRYHISLEKVPEGYKGVCYDYQTKEFKTDYINYDEDEGETDLDVLDEENLYVGFFAARYADITVSNVNLVKSVSDTDLAAEISEADKISDPKLVIESNLYSAKTDYNLLLRSSNNSGGKVTILQDGEVIYSDITVYKKITIFPVTLKADDVTTFKIMFTPSYISPDLEAYQELASYEPQFYEWKITHKSNFDTTKECIFVSPDGSPAGTGDIDDPMPFDTAYGLMTRGQKIILLPGTYTRSEKLEIDDSNSGTPSQPKYLIGFNKYQAEEDGYDVDGYEDVPDGIAEFDMSSGNNGIICHADNWVFKNISVTNGGKNAKPFHVGGSNCLIENVKVHDCQDSGINLSRTSSSQLTREDWPSNNLFKYCEVWNCADASYNNSDGFATKLTVGYGNKLVGCVSHHTSDDGWDLFCKQSGGYMAPVTLEGCVTYKTGYRLTDEGEDIIWSQERGGKNGFKMGGDYMPINNVLIDCIAFENGNSGVTSNSNPLMTVRGCVAYMNEGSNFSMGSNSTLSNCRYDVKGLVSYKPQSGKSNGGDSITGFDGYDSYSIYDNGKDDPTFVPVLDEDGKQAVEVRNRDYNFIKRTSDANPRNASGREIVEQTITENGVSKKVAMVDIREDGQSEANMVKVFVSLDSPVVDGRIPQDPATGEFLLNGFLELTPEFKAYIESREGYEDPEEDEPESTETTTEESKDSTGKKGGGSAKKSNSTSSSQSGSQGSDSSDSSSSDSQGSDSSGDKNGTGSAADSGTSSNAADSSAKVSADNGGEIRGASGIEGKVSVSSSGGNAVSVKLDTTDKSDIEKITEVRIPFDGDTSNPDLIVAVFTGADGAETVIESSYYDTSIGKVIAPFIGEGDYTAVLKSVSFADMTNNWAKAYVEALAARGIVNGVSGNMFEPNANIKRGDFVIMLTKVIGISSNKDSGFGDVSSSDYFSAAVAAAREYGLVKGISSTEFGARADISRQDVMTIIARTLDLAGVSLESADLSQFSDAADISDYAKDSVAKLAGANIVFGNNGAINPKDSMTRAEAAKILYEVWKKF